MKYLTISLLEILAFLVSFVLSFPTSSNGDSNSPFLWSTSPICKRSQLLSQLAIPLAVPAQNEKLTSSWLQFNPAYGALLWRHKALDALAVILGASGKPHSANELSSTASKANAAISAFYKEIALLHTTINRIYHEGKLVSSPNFGTLAGYLFLHENHLINRDTFRKKVKRYCPWASRLNLELLKEEKDFVAENGFYLDSFGPSLISTYVYVKASQCKTHQKAKAYLEKYRLDFAKVLSSHLPCAVLKIEESFITSNDEVLNSGIKKNSMLQKFIHLVNLLTEDFVASQMPTAVEMNFNVAIGGVQFANCFESAFINWMIGSIYNAEYFVLDPKQALVISHTIEKQEIITFKPMIELLDGKCGFEAFYDTASITALLQNLAYVSYAKLRIGNAPSIDHKARGNDLVGFVRTSQETFDLFTDDLEIEIDGIHGKLILAGSFYSEYYFIFAQERVGNEKIFLYEVVPTPMNILILAHHMGNKGVCNKFAQARDIFEYCNEYSGNLNRILKDSSVFNCKAIKMHRNEYELEFSFGKMYLTNFEHGIFQFFRYPQSINYKDYSIIRKDKLLSLIYNPNVPSDCAFDQLFSAIIANKNQNHPSWKNLDFVCVDKIYRKLFFNQYLEKLELFFDDYFDFWIESFIEFPSYSTLHSSMANVLNNEFINQVIYSNYSPICTSIMEKLELANDEERKRKFFLVLAVEYGRQSGNFDLEYFKFLANQAAKSPFEIISLMNGEFHHLTALELTDLLLQDFPSNDNTIAFLITVTKKFMFASDYIFLLWDKIYAHQQTQCYLDALMNEFPKKKIPPSILIAFLLRSKDKSLFNLIGMITLVELELDEENHHYIRAEFLPELQSTIQVHCSLKFLERLKKIAASTKKHK